MTNDRVPLRFRVVDVFTRRRFSGNPVAVVFDWDEVADATIKQAIAAEFGYSETTFVSRSHSESDTATVAIHTPVRELTFAGHPTLGTAHALFLEGIANSDTLRLREPIGSIPVRQDRLETDRYWLRHPGIRFEAAQRVGQIAGILGIEQSDIDDQMPALIALDGPRHLLIPLKTADAVGRASVEAPALKDYFASSEPAGIYIFAPITPDWTSVRCRMFAPLTSGVPEDPATGSAAGELGWYLSTHDRAPAQFTCHQGSELGRPSELLVSVNSGEERFVEVGGDCVSVAEGILEW